MAVTAVSNGIGLNALGSGARVSTFPPNPFAKTEPNASEPAARGAAPGAPRRRELSPTGATVEPTLPGQPKPTVDLPGLVTAQQAKAAGQDGAAGSGITAPGGKPDGAPTGTDESELSEEEKAIVAKLRARDQEVKRHEQAHAAAGGQYAGAPSYTYQQGPDGKQYAIGGQTPIDASPIPGDPEATARKMEQVRRAALAPGSPSGADQAIASAATAAALQAKAQASALRRQEAESQRAEAQQPAIPVVPAPASGASLPGTSTDKDGKSDGGGSASATASSSNGVAATVSAPSPTPSAAVQVGAYSKSNTLAIHSMPVVTMSCSCMACMPREIRSSTSF